MNLKAQLPMICVILAAALIVGVTWSQAAEKPRPAAIREELLKLHNKEREEADFEPLSLNAKLTKAAQSYAEYLAKSGEFSHTAKGTMRSRVEDEGYDANEVGENIAKGQAAASDVVKGWMESETHKGNILSEEFSEVGFGFATDEKGQMIWVTVFGGS
ncbi:Cysteine-rich secretory protein family protein [Anatilimnocola aggregata]|uniref:Cysteine-rich secretory protein family protein n=1 Tax=Anatilimnocola aggregata TaxID=2528021 RepID=A0A517YFS6_9BACT|nr:CAP domain-containing protein [Anatilimnocola aggregata]QDU29087.1 Cysteine-rich secretory protein family protein [Anatilimnocola aggregata]